VFHKLLHTDWDRTLAFLRMVAGGVMLMHGAQKLLGWFGGPGVDGTLGMFRQMGIASPLGLLVVATEFFGALALMAGFLERVAALAIVVDMIVAVMLVHVQNGFFMNWTGMQPGEGFEYHILLIGMTLPLLVRGAGAWSIDYALTRFAAEQRHTGEHWRDAHAH
jgi:putative oxidoreductase